MIRLGAPPTAGKRHGGSSSKSSSYTVTMRGGQLLLLVTFYVGMIGFALHCFYWTPTPQPANGDAARFSEGRARQHVSVLTERIGVRSVSTPGLQAAHHYIWDLTQQLQAAAEARGDILVHTAFENYTGSNDFDFVGERFINTHHNISNIILHISRQGVDHMPAVLLVAHHDSPVASPGAGDDASNIGVMLELAHNLLATPAEELPPVPVMFLFSGAEEPLCQSAAAFMSSSAWASRVGVFINLESIGPGGSPIVFQHAGAWTIEAFAKGAAHPRGAIAGQDIFDAGLVLGDTDYRQLSYRDRGQLPGIDVAYLLTGAAYHTQTDTLDAIRPGVLQETGQTMTAAIKSLASALAAAAAVDDDTAADADASTPAAAASKQQPTLQQLLQPTDHKRMFVSIASVVMLTYSSKLARVLHNLPLVLVLTAPHTLQLLFPSKALPAAEGLQLVLWGAVRTFVTLLMSLGVPAALGAVRAMLSGTALIWFAHPVLGFAMYFPVAVAMLLLPWSHVDYSTAKGMQQLPYHTLGAALFNSAVAVGLTQIGAGTGMVFAMWGGAGVLVALCLTQGVTYLSIIVALASAALPIYACCETALVLSIVMMSRMSLTGNVFIGLGDAIVGLLLGLGALSITGGTVLPLLQVLLGKPRSRKLAGVLLLTGVLVGAGCSVASVFPYSASMPKRLILAHMHYTEPSSPSADPTAVPSMRIANSSWVMGGADSNPVSWVVTAMGFDPTQTQPYEGNELMLIFPVSKIMDVLKFPATASDGSSTSSTATGELPYARLTQPPQQQAGFTEVHVEVVVPKPCWGTLKFTRAAGISGWSIHGEEGDQGWQDAGSFLSKQQSGSGSAMVGSGAHTSGSVASTNKTVSSLMIKFTNEHQQQPLHWPIGLRMAADGSGSSGEEGGGELGLTVELHVGYLDPTPELAAVEQRMPAWSTLSYRTTVLVSKWEF